jgi:hypothetical protein
LAESITGRQKSDGKDLTMGLNWPMGNRPIIGLHLAETSWQPSPAPATARRWQLCGLFFADRGTGVKEKVYIVNNVSPKNPNEYAKK